MPSMHWAMESASTQRFSEPTWDIPLSLDPKKDLAQKIQVTEKPAQWRASARVRRGKSAALEPPGGYQISLEGEMRSE